MSTPIMVNSVYYIKLRCLLACMSFNLLTLLAIRAKGGPTSLAKAPQATDTLRSNVHHHHSKLRSCTNL